MFNKPAFGSNTSGFGSFNSGAATASPFGGFKPATQASGFGAPPAFGSATAQPQTGGLFGASNTSTGLFGGSTSTATPAFGNTSAGFGFGASTSTGGLFGANNASTGLFGNAQNTSSFGAKPAGFSGFGTPSAAQPATGGLFGAAPAANTGLFGQQTNTLGGGLFSNNTSTFGAGQAGPAGGTAHAKYSPLLGTDVVVKSGTSQTINIKHHCITCMKEYENKSLEELRVEDYAAGRKGNTSGMFGFQQQTEAKPLFGGTTAFGQPAATTASGVFGGGLAAGGGFGQTSTFSFGNNTQNTTNTTGGLFGAAKPAFGAAATPGTGLFGAATTQAAPTFGATSAPSFGFGSTTQNQTGGLFGAKPATTGFGTGTTGSFGSFSGGSLFGAKPAQTAAPAFGTATPAFGGMSGGFGTNTSTAGGGLFGANNTFGKPTTTQPAFGFNAPATGLGAGLGGGLGANSFQNKPAAPAFGTLGGGLFNTQANNTFGQSAGSGLGGGLFGNTSGLGGSALGGMGLGNTTMQANNSLSGASAAGNVHEQILTLVARPYGDSPLFKDLPIDPPSSAEEVLKPTNPAALKAVLDSNNSYRVTDRPARLRVHQPRAHDKKSLFDGLEESDPSLEDKLTLKPSRKRLVLRPKAADSVDGVDVPRNRSLEGQPQSNNVNPNASEATEDERRTKDTSNQENNNLEASSDRHGSWLNASKHQWSAEKEKPAEMEPTPRLYPNLEKENPLPTVERRASWLKTKPLRKPLSSNPDSAENSVRDLGLRTSERSLDKENVDSLSVSEEEPAAPRPLPPHPTGVKLTRPGYYTIPSLDEMTQYMRPDGSCVVPHLTIGRKNYGNVYFDCEIDVAGLDLDALVHFMNKEVTIYPDDADKPATGSGLNRRAIITLDRVWPRDKTDKRPITDPDRLQAMDYDGKLRRVCDRHGTKFIEYRPQTGSWVFRVEHFSKYSAEDSDEEDDPAPEVMKRQLINNQMQKAAALAPPKPPAQAGLGGLGGPNYPPGLSNVTPSHSAPNFSSPGLSGPGPSGPSLSSPGLSGPGLSSPGLSGPGLSSPGLSGPGLSSLAPMMSYGLGGPALIGHDDLYAMQQTSLNLLSGAGKAFEMDTTEDNAEAQSMYQDSNRAFGVKSPTSELARLEHRRSHHVQLMKASLYADTEVSDDMSVSTEDQMVPRGAQPVPSSAPDVAPYRDTSTIIAEDHSQLTATEEIPMKPLIVRPHTIVLKYHRKVLPFKKTIAGRLDAAYIADMNVCRARHSRAGFGPRASVVFPTSYDAVTTLPRSAELSELSRYVRGRGADDWSEALVARLALHAADDTFLETMTRHLETLLEYSTFEELSGSCPRASIVSDPKERRAALLKLTQHCSGDRGQVQFGVSSSYCHEVFRLCDALWGADLENEGVAGTDEASVVNRHKKLLAWLTTAVSDVTDDELRQPVSPEEGDESDAHSARVWTLLLGGRILEACKVCVEHGDYNMAMLIAQCSGDATFRSLVSKQLSLWTGCGVDELIASPRRAALHLLAGRPSPRLADTDWLRVVHATCRYLCPPVPSLEHVIRTYEGLLVRESDGEGVDLTLAGDDLDMELPLPPYWHQYDVTVQNGEKRRVLDLRYELLKARAMNTRPKLQPAAYTPDPMDYSLCFILGAWFGNPSLESITGVASQLEACGAWHLAIQALQHHPNHAAREHLIRGVLSRNAPAVADTAELKARLDLVRRLRVPNKWLLVAQAHRAKYERLPAVEAEHLVGAEQWNAAHRVLLDELLPEAVLSDKLQSISSLVERLSEAAGRHLVSGWEAGGQAVHHYIHVCDEIRGLVSSEPRGSITARLEALRPRVSAACRALGRLAPPTLRHAAARADMGARLVQLAVAAGEPPGHVAALLNALRLPPDCTNMHATQIATDLAEAASEMCIESANSSPISSHHRTTAQS